MGPTRDNSRLRRRLSFLGVVVFFTALAIVFHRILLPFIVAGFMAFVMEPVVSRLTGRRLFGRPIVRWVAVLLVDLTFFVAVGATGAIAGPRLGDEARKLIADAPRFFQRVKGEWIPAVNETLRGLMQRFGSDETPDAVERSRLRHESWRPELRDAATRSYRAALAELRGQGAAPTRPKKGRAIAIARRQADGSYAFELDGAALEVQEVSKHRFQIVMKDRASAAAAEPPPEIDVERALETRLQTFIDTFGARLTDYVTLGQRLLTGVLGALGLIGLTFVIAAFLSIDLQAFHRFFRSLVPRAWHEEYDDLMAELDRGLSGVIRGQLVICVINGALTAIGLYALGVPYAGIWSLIAAVMSLIPVFGTILSSAPMIGVSLFTTEPTGLLGLSGIGLAVAVLVWILVIHFIEASVLEPKIVGKHARIHPVLVLFALLAGEHFYGVPGLVFAVPVLSVVQTLFLFLKEKIIDEPAQEPGPEPPQGAAG